LRNSQILEKENVTAHAATKQLKQGNISSRTRNDFTEIVWRDKLGTNMLTNTNDPPPNGNFGDERGNSIKPAITQN
jgi:hypothetical protein